MKPLGRELINQYDINIKKYQYIRSNYYVDTNKGKFVLRRVEVPKEQILFSYEVDTHLVQRQFKGFSHIISTKKKLPYAIIGEQYYIMQVYEPCEETDFKLYEDLRGIVTALALFHKYISRIESNIRDIEDVKIKNIYQYYLRRQIENTKLKKNILALKQKSNFEMMFLEGCEDYRHLEEVALSSIDLELVERLIKQVKGTKSVAHKDFTYHTVNKSEKREYIISQLDTCNYDIQVLDLAQILSKMMQKNGWNDEILYQLIEEYNKERTLSSDEFRMLKFMLIYPDKFNSICFKYLSSKRRWNYSMFEQKWENMCTYKDKQIKVAKQIMSW